ncbi:hypothetical protein [Desnuesiella massiliensis]|uniref:hypothetical protein n=1 Tax=Desnuesiella massiliensis TaxID=1650662 RepID=UPI0006E3D1EE|nr:hypothetical protein [Desnuesiella massiliensis]
MCTNKTLYFIEGLPGVGKTTICEWIHEKTGAKCILENGLNYPNDLYKIAGIPLDVYNKICCNFSMLSDFVEQHGMYTYVNIEEVRNCFPNQYKLLNILSEWDIGDEFNPYMTLSHYIPCSLEFLKNRFTQLEQNGDSIIFDSVWLQNPINELLSRNVDNETIIKYCSSFAEMLKKYNLNCIYLKRNNSDETIKFARYAKGEVWTNRVAELISKTPYGIAHKLEGFDGMIKYFSTRAKIEQEVISRGFIKCLQYTVNENNWDELRELIWEDVKNIL